MQQSPLSYTDAWNVRRSILRCLKDAWLIIALHFRSLLKTFLPVALLAGLAFALLSVVAMSYVTDCGLPARHLHEQGADGLALYVLIPSWPAVAMAAVAVVLTVLTSYWADGRAIGLLRRYASTGSFMPAEPGAMLTATDRALSRRLLLADICMAGITLVVSGIVVLASWLTSWWVLLVLLLPFSYLLPAIVSLRTAYAFSGRTLKACLKECLWRRWGGYFVVQLVGGIPVAIVKLVPNATIAICAMASYAIGETLLMGDTPVAPSGLPVLFFVLYALAFTGILIVNLYAVTAVALYVQNAALGAGSPTPADVQ